MSKSHLVVVATITAMCSLSSYGAGKAFDEQPHILITVGHTNSADWDAGLGKYVATCDYKSIDGAVPRLGESCDGSPRVFLTVEDLTSLKYIVQAGDHIEFVRRVYQQFPQVLFVSSPDTSFNYGSSAEKQTSEIVDFRTVLPNGVSARDYDFLASRATAYLADASSGVYSRGQVVGAVMGPYSNDVMLGGNLENTQRVLPEYTIAFFYKNPDRGTLVHELLHFLITRARARSIARPERFIELGQNDGKMTYLHYLFFDDANFVEEELDPKLLAYWDLQYLQYILENKASSSPEELEVAYFIAKYGHQLNLPSSSILAHRNDFWKYVEAYRKAIDETYGNPIKGYVPESIIEPINSNASFELNGRVIPGFFKNYFKRILTIAKAYPKDLLGDENNVNRRNPRTIIDHFVVDVGPRASTTAQR